MASTGPSAQETAQQTLEQLRLSIDGAESEGSPNGLFNGVNGKSVAGGSPSPRSSGEHTGLDRAAILQRELDRCRKEKDALAAQYQSLLAKLNNMRTSVTNKLKQDAVRLSSSLFRLTEANLFRLQEELDRREQAIQQLAAQNEDLTATITALQTEIVTSNAEAERASKELEALRSRAYEDTSQEAAVRERELREMQVELERCRIERDEWEREAMEGRIALDEAKSSVENYKRDLEIEREVRERKEAELEAEREKAINLQSVLEDFQAGKLMHNAGLILFINIPLAKDHELRQAVRDRDAQITQVTQALAEYKHRAHTAEVSEHHSFEENPCLFLPYTVATRRKLH